MPLRQPLITWGQQLLKRAGDGLQAWHNIHDTLKPHHKVLAPTQTMSTEAESHTFTGKGRGVPDTPVVSQSRSLVDVGVAFVGICLIPALFNSVKRSI